MASLRLTKAMREEIVDRIMNDVPKVDHERVGREELLEAAVAALPDVVRKMWKGGLTSDYVNVEHLYVPESSIGAMVPGPRNRNDAKATIPDEAWEKLASRGAAHKKQARERSEMRSRLMAQLGTIANVAEFERQFPTLVRYGPNVAGKTSNLPATTQIIDMLAAAGLPDAEAASND
jgi:hypothetical protein